MSVVENNKCSVEKCKNSVSEYGRCYWHLCINPECKSKGAHKFVQNGKTVCEDCNILLGKQEFGQHWKPNTTAPEKKLYAIDQQLRQIESLAVDIRNKLSAIESAIVDLRKLNF
jgi:hypothetical protein